MINVICHFLWFFMWMTGIVLAKGFWSTFFAITTGGLWSSYLVIQKLLIVIGWL